MKRLSTIILLIISVVFSKDLQIIHMEGTFDLDQDGLYEFAAIEVGQDNGHSVSMIRYYEIDGDGYQQLNWELAAPDGLLGNFVNLKLGDLDGDGNPELITIMNLTDENEERILHPIVYHYPWDGEGFSETPASTLNLSERNTFLRCHNFELLNMDGDDDQELVVSLGSPVRGLAIVDVNEEGQLFITNRLEPETMRFGSGFVYAGAVDWNNDGFDDIISFSPEGNVMKAQPFLNKNGSFIQGEENHITVSGMNGLLNRAVTITDWDADGFLDVIAPFQSGHLIALTLSQAGIDIDNIPNEAGPLSGVQIADFDHDTYTDLLLVSGEMNMMTVSFGAEVPDEKNESYFTLSVDTVDIQIFSALPVMEQGQYTGTSIAAGWDGDETSVFLTDLGLPPPVDKPIVQDTLIDPIDLLDIFPEIEGREIGSLAAGIKPIKSLGQPLPKGVLPRHVLPVEQLFVYSIPEDEANQFYSFRWLLPPPKGMFFHYETRSIQWVPNGTQLGAYKLAYHVEMKTGEMVELESEEIDSLLTYKVVPHLEGYDERLWIYVNDSPEFISEPIVTEFVANSLFTYSPIINDYNEDANVQFTLDVSPDGMEMDSSGSLYWQTDSSHVNIYDVRIVASDGFDRAAQEFQLFARAGVKILSEADSIIRVNELFKYQVDVWRPDLDQELTYKMLYYPEGMTLSESGLVEWTPAATQIDSQNFAIVANHGVAADTQEVILFVNHPPVIDRAPPPINKVNLGYVWDFQLEVTDPNTNDELTYTVVEMPDGMRMDPFTGRLRWEPTRDEMDFGHLKVEVDDGKDIRTVEADFFINSPIKLVSIPVMQATVGQQYKYKIMTTDLNKGSLLPFDHVVKLVDTEKARVYAVNIADDIYRENVDRYIGDWNAAEVIFLTSQGDMESEEFSRLNLKRYVHSIFWEDDRLMVIIEEKDDRSVSVKDVLWEFFQGSKGKPPKVIVERRSAIRYTLEEFPDGMEVDEFTGTLLWTPGKDQYDNYTIKLVVSDGYTKDEQSFELYVNHPATIVSQAPKGALVEEMYKYQIQVEDKNKDAELHYELLKGPQGMQISNTGKIVWIPKASQVNKHSFAMEVSDGYHKDHQTGNIFVNIPPSIISKPKPVGLTGYEYRYKVVAEDLNNDRVSFRSIRLPKYASFNKKTGLFKWRPRNNQRGPHDIIITAIDARGATTTHQFQIHVFENPDARRFVNTGWPLMLTFVGVMFAWGVAQF
ncbi:MAG: putative Ig domain-containing protein [Candidatus Marinimicrobia bacterium]|nr:putative Ig domain-containing protein [Candidatus Neomarinimicrobiota bacterium]MDP7095227.1 putative Ig domain-containing protein [Candidatus Neomarinimicrobiota bacterium]MDP7512409.1 putative Ig domain-containing protein [Candidatus Neomarinimicrobiota bacterium]